MIAGGIGGSTGDMLMHSLDTVKTRQQGDPNIPSKYTSLGQSYYTIWRQEGIRKGLYGGWLPALGGSFPGTVMFFGTYEWSKRALLDMGMQQHLAYLSAGKLLHHSKKEKAWKLTRCRIPGRSSSFNRLRPLRSPQNPTTTPGTLQQPALPLRLQLPRHHRRRPHHRPHRRRRRPVPRLQSDAVPRPALLRAAVHVLGAVPRVGADIQEQQGRGCTIGAGHGWCGWWFGGCDYLSA